MHGALLFCVRVTGFQVESEGGILADKVGTSREAVSYRLGVQEVLDFKIHSVFGLALTEP